MSFTLPTNAPADPTKATRFKGPTKITLRGAQSKGNDYTYGSAGPVGSGGDVGLIIGIPSAQFVDAFEIQQPDGTVVTAFDSAGGLVLTGASNISRRVAKVALTAANLIAMYATPVQILAAPGAGLAIVALQVLFEITTTATAFTGGGVVLVQYDNTAHAAGTAVHAGSVPAAVVTASAGTSLTGLWAASGANGLTIPANKGLFISNQTAAFAAGTGTAIVTVSYGLVTL